MEAFNRRAVAVVSFKQLFNTVKLTIQNLGSKLQEAFIIPDNLFTFVSIEKSITFLYQLPTVCVFVSRPWNIHCCCCRLPSFLEAPVEFITSQDSFHHNMIKNPPDVTLPRHWVFTLLLHYEKLRCHRRRALNENQLVLTSSVIEAVALEDWKTIHFIHCDVNGCGVCVTAESRGDNLLFMSGKLWLFTQQLFLEGVFTEVMNLNDQDEATGCQQLLCRLLV